ncbi:30S ribosomal protein S6 alpha, chloroplastic-like [Cucurbita maxima]|uniref:30S ribosomal protein S6 alpha, chloroplastic-like n=1 Tax=Cucurbita maxima TaxID=3661 RepID=A0A6J1K3V4_CUCMA|nr:30S ribosomal protein S6 alpha, chloroplastic-like [Cucurbita maxima]
MAFTSTLTATSSASPLSSKPHSLPQFTPHISFPFTLRSSKSLFSPDGIGPALGLGLSVKAQTLEFSGSFFQGGFGTEDEPPTSPGTGFAIDLEDKEEPQCPPGLRKYESMVVLRPDMSEDERLALTQKYEELLVAGGGMYVEVFHKGVVPLAYSIKKKNKAGETNTYLDGISLLFTYFTKPESMGILEATLQADDDVVRSMSFKVRKRKY